MTEAEWLTCNDPRSMFWQLELPGTVQRVVDVFLGTRRDTQDAPRLGSLIQSVVSAIGRQLGQEELRLLDPHGSLSRDALRRIQERIQQSIPAHEDAPPSFDPFQSSCRTSLSERKLRLFACACCRKVWRWMVHQNSRAAVECSEEYAEGKVTAEALVWAGKKAEAAIGEVTRRVHGVSRFCRAARAAHRQAAQHPAARETAREAMLVLRAVARREHRDEKEADRAASNEQAQLIRCIIGNPFRPVQLDPAWVAWNDGAVRKISQMIYDERRFSDLPLLADALEESGCTNADILAHCRGPGPHARGCWVVDLLTDRK